MRKERPKLLFEISRPGRRAVRLPENEVPETEIPAGLRRKKLTLPELSELDVVRYFTRLSQLNFSIDTNFYPLGSCTMKYNPKLNEATSSLEGFSGHHPLTPMKFSQGSLELIYRLQAQLSEISGFAQASLQPAAGAQGELTGVLMIRAYHTHRGDTKRRKMLIPDSAHGTNPATVTMAGYEVVEIPSDTEGNVDLQALKAACDDTVAGLMITNPNTLGLFERRIEEVTKAVHDCGGLVYGDGANMNAILGILRPGDVGIDVMHFNLHKTFSTPHGGGGPGAGPVATNEKLVEFLPGPIVEESADGFRFHMPKHTIGRMKAFHGSFGMLVRAFTYILSNGGSGLRELSEIAVLNANYLKHKVSEVFPAKYNRTCMHEFVSVGKLSDRVHTMDVAKRLLDYGMHAPTVYFPLIVKEALMIEPTESESVETLDEFAAVLLKVAKEAEETPELLEQAPHEMPLRRLDEVYAAKNLVLRAQDLAEVEL
ncbi:MAG: glycine dehydrogenase subunit 2 [Spirochaetaceae bacterium]|nr:MAG: glycine dehydrogenase subunit 2 [Spirochaetaceae bacterium]